MDNIKIFEVIDPLTEEVSKHIQIDRGNGEFTSMPKAIWDELEAAKENGTIS